MPGRYFVNPAQPLFREGLQFVRAMDRVAGQLVARMDELFAVDAEARAAGMDHAARHALRGMRSVPLGRLRGRRG